MVVCGHGENDIREAFFFVVYTIQNHHLHMITFCQLTA